MEIRRPPSCLELPETTDPVRSSRLFWMLMAGMIAVRVILAWRLDPCYDEGYYFYWSLFPQWSYWDHPPLTAWSMTLSRFFLGDSVWSIRLWPLLAGTVVTLIGRDLGRRIFSLPAGNRAGIFLATVPAFAGNGLFMTPDALLAPSWAGAVWATYRALVEERHRHRHWLLAGFCGGVGLLAKYNMVLFFLGLIVLWALRSGRRQDFLQGSILAGVVALIVFTPVLIWNAQNEWGSFRFQMSHGFAARKPLGVTLPAYAGGLLLVGTPVLAVLVFRSAWRAMASPCLARRMLAIFFWVVPFFFVFSAWRRTVGPNWLLMGFFTGVILVGADWPTVKRGWRAAAAGVLAACALCSIVGLLFVAATRTTGFTLGGQWIRIPRAEELVGGEEFARKVEQHVQKTSAAFVAVTRHQLFARLAFFSPTLRPNLWLLQEGLRRFPWLDNRIWRGRDALIVVRRSGGGDRLRRPFHDIEPSGTIILGMAKQPTDMFLTFMGRKYDPEISVATPSGAEPVPVRGTGRP